MFFLFYDYYERIVFIIFLCFYLFFFRPLWQSQSSVKTIDL